ncbi:MAG: SbcC/MukB-like Walker B domain-containing protein [Acidimicrobiales bacterium]
MVHADTAEARQAKLAEIIADAEQHEAVVRQAGEQLTALDRAATSFAPDPSVLDPLGDLARRGAQLLAEREQLTATQREAEARRDAAVESQAALLRGFADQQQARGAISLLRSSSAILAELDDEAERVEAELAQLRADAPSPDEPAAITDVVTSAAAEVARATEQLSEANQRLDEASAAWLSLGELGDHVAKNRLALDEAQSAADTARAEAAVAGASVATAEAALAAAKAEQQEAMRTNAAVVAAQGIAAGDPCPVCRQATPHDFAPPVAADVDAAAQHVEAAEATVAAARRAVTAADTTATHRAEALAAATHWIVPLVAVGEARAAVVALSLDPDATDADVALGAVRLVVDSAREALDAATATASAAERQQIAAAAERTAALAAHERDLAACQRRQEQIGARRASQRTQLDGLPEAWFIGSDAPTAELEARAAAIESMVIELEALVAAAAAADADAAAAKQRFAELRAEAVETVNTPVGDIVRLLNEQVTTAAQLQPFLADATGSDPLPEPLPTPVLLDQLETLVPAARELVDRLQPVAAAVATARGQLALQQQAAAAALSALLESAGVADAGSLHAQAGAARAEAARARADIEVLERQVAAADGLDAMLDIGQPYLANLELLIQSLRDQHFVDHLVSMREVELLGEATRRLKAISNGRYGFVPDFGVVRIASGEVRSPDTLSGGERFQAALALALALVEIASRGAGKLDAVFVDEGFGSLDGAALDVALDTLGSVAGGGKLVALISHLPPGAEYVDTVFSVTKDDLFGSTITKLDAEAREAARRRRPLRPDPLTLSGRVQPVSSDRRNRLGGVDRRRNRTRSSSNQLSRTTPTSLDRPVCGGFILDHQRRAAASGSSRRREDGRRGPVVRGCHRARLRSKRDRALPHRSLRPPRHRRPPSGDCRRQGRSSARTRHGRGRQQLRGTVGPASVGFGRSRHRQRLVRHPVPVGRADRRRPPARPSPHHQPGARRRRSPRIA